jgi:putative transposase
MNAAESGRGGGYEPARRDLWVRPQLPAERWQRVVASLEAVQAAGEPVTPAVRKAASRLRVSRSTVWAHLVRGSGAGQDRARRPRYTLTRKDRAAYYRVGGNAAGLARARGGTAGRPSLRTLQRAVARDLSEMERVYARAGWRAARQIGPFRKLPALPRNTEWQTDHKQLGVTVVLPGGGTGKPWITSFVDVGTRVVQGWAVDLRPTETTVTCALRRALQATPFPGRDGLPAGSHGGVPARIRVDRGLEFAASGLSAAAGDLGIDLVPCWPYQPHRKGTVERWHRTLDQTMLSELPFFDAGPRKADGSLYAPAGAMWTLAELVAGVEEWITGYHDRPHSMLGGASPWQAWLADPTPVREVGDEMLRGLLHRARRVVSGYGIRLKNVYYLAPRLYGRHGEVEIRYDVHAPTELLVYVGGHYLDTAFPQDTATPEQVDAFRAEKRCLIAAMRRDRAAATRAMRLRIRPMTGAGPVVGTAVMPVPGAPPLHPSENPAARRRASASLRPGWAAAIGDPRALRGAGAHRVHACHGHGGR